MSDVKDTTTRTITKGEPKLPAQGTMEAMGITSLEILQAEMASARVHTVKLSYVETPGLVSVTVGASGVHTQGGLARQLKGDITPQAADHLLEALLIWKYRGCE